ncbi:hypothetical protein ABZ756_12810, partial [Mammaliicoccus sciuri]
MVKETTQKEKSTNKKILPFVMSTSMLTAAIFGAGGSAFAAEEGEEKEFKNHGAEVSSFATSTPGSPEKGSLMRTIANKNLQEKAQNEDDSDDFTDEDEATDVTVEEEDTTHLPVID